MSNNNINKIINENKYNKEKYILFNDFLKNLNQYKSIGDSLDIVNHQIYLQKNKINLSKYTKIDGSKSFLLDTINSIITKDDLCVNLDNCKTIMDNLEFISDNSKYINNIKNEQTNIKKYLNKNSISSNQKTNYNQKNLFFINKDKICLNNDANNNNIFLSGNNSKNKNLYENENIMIDTKSNISENIEENKETNKINNTIKKYKISNDNLTEKTNINIKNTSSSLYRQDYYVKQFKVQYSIWLRNFLNNKLKQLVNETKNNRRHLKFYPLNSLKFTANPKYEDNKLFLSLKIKDILIVGIDSAKNSNQKKNKENIEIIENIIYKQNKNINNELLNFLNCTMEDSIKIFYQSEQFLKFKDSEQAKINDEKFVQEKHFSLLNNNGFVYLIKNYKGNSKSNIIFSNG